MSETSERIVVTSRDHLELQAWEPAAPAPGEVRVRVSYSAISFGDVMLRRHVFRPVPRVAVPGYEVVGTIDAVGAGVSLRAGQRVAAFIEYGGNARHAIVRAGDVVALPDEVADAPAAAVVLNYATALGMIEAAGLKRGDSLLVHGASGGVGSAVLDVAQALGMRALGTTRGASKAALFGATLFDARSTTLVADVRAASNGGVRAVFDSRAGRGLWASRRMVARGGSLVVTGLSSVAHKGLRALVGTAGSILSIGLFRVLPGKRSAVFAMDTTYHRTPERVRALVARAVDLLASGAIAPIVAATLPLAEVARAQQLVERGVVGKVLIDCR